MLATRHSEIFFNPHKILYILFYFTLHSQPLFFKVLSVLITCVFFLFHKEIPRINYYTFSKILHITQNVFPLSVFNLILILCTQNLLVLFSHDFEINEMFPVNLLLF